jgi:negative regulator of flagellin synthesis FlgM
MAVKISSLSSNSLMGLGGSGAVERDDRTPESGASEGDQADSLNLTASASQLLELESRIKDMPVVDARMVEEVKRQLATGSFRIDPERSASKLLWMEKYLK